MLNSYASNFWKFYMPLAIFQEPHEQEASGSKYKPGRTGEHQRAAKIRLVDTGFISQLAG